ncbi:MAG TPA: hypothetical protein VFE05_19205 [Longimicrobiaceae bacterium]|jgi:hypothetical protein|nr:hypothetical protein [Longimicrobiaceae bacterium]
MRIRIPRISLSGIFSRIAGETPEPAETAAAPASEPVRRDVGENASHFSVPVTFMRSDVPDVDSAFGYGHLDGRRGVSPENFRDFIAHTVEGEGIDLLLADLEAREKAAREKAASLRQQRAEIAGKTEELSSLAEGKAAANQALKDAAAELTAAEAQAGETHAAGSLTQGTLFLAAGLVFIAGDVVMSQKIVADALGLTGSNFLGVDESWMFALGLAMISIVLKPAYDRLVETPYWQGKRTRFTAVICTLALASFVTLWVLGAFRAESYGTQTKITMLQANAALSAAEKGSRLMDLQEQMLSSSLARWSFILSGTLFAAAGAVSLSIGLRYLHDRRYLRRAAAKRKSELASAHLAAREAQRRVADELPGRTAELKRLLALTADEPAAAALELRADDLAGERRELLARRVEVRTNRLRSLYDDGYELGGNLETRESEDAAAATAAERPRRKRPRPFVALRRTIREIALSAHSSN